MGTGPSGTNRIRAFVIAYSDSSFSNPHSIVTDSDPVFDSDAFTFVGKEMDGLESRRHRAFSIAPEKAEIIFNPDAANFIRLGLIQKSRLSKVVISTKWFTGNQVPRVSLELLDSTTGAAVFQINDLELSPDSERTIEVNGVETDECLIRCFYDGGISRVRFYGAAIEAPAPRKNILEDAAIIFVSNEHYGKPSQAVSGRRLEHHMVGWESARTGLGESALFELKAPLRVSELEVDTYKHVFNAPLCCALYGGSFVDGIRATEIMKQAPRWRAEFENGAYAEPTDLRSYIYGGEYKKDPNYRGGGLSFKLSSPKDSSFRPLLPFGQLSPDALHRFKLAHKDPVTHILFMHFPNGGIHGLRIFSS